MSQVKVVRTACTLDCPDTCTLQVTVDEGRVVSIDACPDDDANPLSSGFICRKVGRSATRVHSPERVMTPLVRVGPKGAGSFREASWDEALDLVAGRIGDALASEGPDSVIPYLYNSSSGILEAEGSMVELFARLGCPRVDHTICAKTYGEAWEQVYPGLGSADPLSIPHARLLVVWGANSTVSNSHLTSLVTQCRKNGGIVVVVDPRRTGIAARADLHIPIIPGTDSILAMALAAHLDEIDALDRRFIDTFVSGADEFLQACSTWTLADAVRECGVGEPELEQFIGLLATLKPAMLRLGWGPERNRNGGSGMLAVMSLWALAGNFGEMGSGILGSTSGVNAGTLGVSMPTVDISRATVNMNHVGRLLRGELSGWATPRVLVIQGANPAVTAVDQGGMLEGLGNESVFTVVHDQVMTDTARYADVVLPATTQFEVDDVTGSYGSFTLQRVRRAIGPVGTARGNDQLGRDLAERLSVSLQTPQVSELLDTEIVRTRETAGSVQFRDWFPDGGRARLFGAGSELPLPTPLRGRSDLGEGLRLLTSATSKTVNSMFGEYDAPEAAVSVNPHDAAARSLVDGDTVTVSNDLATVTLTVRVTNLVRPGVCEIPKGLWMRHTESGLVSNALVDDVVNDLGGGACFNEAVVHVRKESRDA